MIWGSLKASSGKIMLNNVDIDKIELQKLRRNISILTQETTLFEGTLRDNLDISALKKDIELVECLEDVSFSHPEYKSDGLEMKIGEDGGNLSEGQRQ